MEPVEIAAGKYQLRPWTERDVDAARVALTDPEIMRWRAPRPPGEQHPGPEEWLTRRIGFWAEGIHACFIVMDAVSGEVLGDVSVQHIDRTCHTAEIGYWVMPKARGAGVATEAAKIASRWAFGALGLHRLTLVHAVGNPGSCRVAQRAGFALEGVMREASPNRDGIGYHDEHLHALIVTDPVP
ncbi:GNAT family N-acetyltransferase [Yinghuangia seranimata]|uniref:GNAT family N-acetyltransferase n=1 Tax=Yinghuangia seranimata TaxID=408067 RepID=UPI00248B7558|nr:GNAT family N-acetyltransferase [Yinghuangia seranimata]MDI2131435.1 GNAT family N-acetyltransferase [Yinghuangia seranimata]